MKKWCTVWLSVILVFLSGCTKKPESVPTQPVSTKKSQMETLTIYSMNPDTMTLMPVSIKKEKEYRISAEYIVFLVQESLSDDEIAIQSVEQKGDTVILSFLSKGKPVTNCSKKQERLILESFANSLLDNVENCRHVIVRADGKAYRSKHLSFGIDEIYASE